MRLLRTALIAAALSLSFTRLAHAQYELAWDKCPGSFGSVTNKRFDCSESSQPLQLVVAFTPPKSLPRFLGIRVDMEVSSASGNLPDWWKAGIGECREGAVTTSLNGNQVIGECRNPWTGTQTGGGSYWTSGFGTGRALVSFAFARVDMTALQAGTRYLAAVINVESAGGGACGGCSSEVCLSVTAFQIAQDKDPRNTTQEPGPDDQIDLTRSTGSSVVSFNASGSGGNACGAKVRNKTWGTVKTTYR